MVMSQSRKLMARGAVAWSLDIDANAAGRFLHDEWELVKHKVIEFAAFFHRLLAELAEKADEAFPPKTRSEALGRWLHVAVTVVLPIVLAVVLLFCCCHCCCRGRGGLGRMMKAPGRGGARMPRGVFEGNPSGYFRDLRAGQPLVF